MKYEKQKKNQSESNWNSLIILFIYGITNYMIMIMGIIYLLSELIKLC